MPIFEYACGNGHATETIRSFGRRDEPMTCECGLEMKRLEVSRSHVPPDGVYSYAPNIGDPERFERQRAAIHDGKKVIPRTPSSGDLERWNDPARPKGTFFGGGA